MKRLLLLLTLLGTLHVGAVFAAPKSKKPALLHPPAPTLPALPVAPLSATPLNSTTPAVASGASDDVVLYGGAAIADEGITLSAWGGGDVQDTSDVSLSKGHALKITTIDPYQGGTLTFQKPTDFDTLRADKTRTLTVVLRPAAVTRHFGFSAPSGPLQPTAPQPGAPPPDERAFRPVASSFLHLAAQQGGQYGQAQGPYPRPRGYPPGGFRPPGGYPGPGGFPPNGFPPGAQPPQASLPQATPNLFPPRFVHLLLTFVGGQQTDVLRPYPTPPDGDVDQWLTLGVPLAALGKEAAGPLQSITVAGDDYGVFYIGQIKVVRDTVPLTCFAGDEQTVSAGAPVTLTGTGQGGASALVYTWDFDASDGITAQATGQTVTTNAFLDSKTYTVTLTVSDLDGLKQPVTSTTKVHVN